MFGNLMKRIERAKKSVMAREALYEVYGQITMALELEAITSSEYLTLNTECVKNGINNPKYF